MKVFEFQWTKEGEKEWVAASSLVAAIREYSSSTGTGPSDWDDNDEIIEIPETEWDNHFCHDPDDIEDKMSFSEWVKQNPHGGMICGTMY